MFRKVKKMLTCILTLAIIFTGVFSISPVAIGAAGVVAGRYDFGTTNSRRVESGWTMIANTDDYAYNAETGYGFADPSLVGSVDRGRVSGELINLRRDFCYALDNEVPIEFIVDLPNGYYLVTVYSGDQTQANSTTLAIEGEQMPDLVSAAGEYLEPTYEVTITDGQLNIVLGDQGKINGLEIRGYHSAPQNVNLKGLYMYNGMTTVNIEWDAVNFIENYNIYRMAQSEGEYVLLDTTEENSFKDTTALAGETYFYKVAANGIYGESELSDVLEVAVVNPSIPIPSAPQGLVLEEATDSNIKINWQATDGAIRYNVYRRISGESEFIMIGSIETPGFTDFDVVTYKTHFYQVSAVSLGGESAKSELTVAPISAPPAPTGIDIKPITQTSIALNWNPMEDAISYNIYRARFGYNDYALIASSETTQFNDSTIQEDSQYVYRISAVNNVGEGDLSVEILGTPQWSFPELVSEIDISSAGTGCRMRLGDMTGDGRYDILMVQPAYEANDAYNPRYVGCLTAYDIEGNLLWQVGKVDSRVVNSGADEPVQIYDIDNDGFNEVLTVMDLGQGKRFYIIDGRNGEIKADYELPNSRAHDAIFIANFSGKETPQDILLKDRYSKIWALDNEFNLLWYYSGNTGHSLLPYDFDGDGRDELVNNYALIAHDGTEIWRKNHPDHVDTHWVADMTGDGQYEILLGGSDTFCYTFEGELLWTNTDTVEPQQILVGDYRLDYPGLEIAGLDRVNRGDPGRDGMFLFSSTGETIYHENRGWGDWGTIVRPLDNWTGTCTPFIIGYRRGSDENNPDGIPPKLYDGFFNPIVTFGGLEYEDPHLDAREQVMVADMCGDARDELIIYNLTGELKVWIYSNGKSNLREHITGQPRMSDFRNYNFSRYDSRVYELTVENLIPSGIKAVVNDSAAVNVTWIPILGADSYNIYRSKTAHGEYTKIGSAVIPEFIDNDAPLGTSYYKVTAVNSEGESKLPIVAASASIDISSVVLSLEQDTLYRTETAQLTITGVLANGIEVDLEEAGATVEFFSSNPNILSVDETGKITANKVGSAEISAIVLIDEVVYQSNSIDVTVKEKVMEEVKGFTISYDPHIVEVGEEVTITITAEQVTGLAGFDACIPYNTELVELKDVIFNENFGFSDYVDNDGIIGILGVLVAQETGLTGDIELARLVFTAKDKDALASIAILEGSQLSDIEGAMYTLGDNILEQFAIANSDITGGGTAINDLVLVAKAFGCSEGDEGYDPKLDMNKDGIIDITDIAYVAARVLKR